MMTVGGLHGAGSLALPVVTGLAVLAAALTLGLLILTATALPVVRPPDTRPPERARPATRTLAHPIALRLVSVTAAVWALAAAAQAVLQDRRVTPAPALATYLRGDPGRGLLLTVVVAAVVAATARIGRSLTTAGCLALLCLVPLVAAAVAGCPVGSIDRDTAVTALGLHLLGVGVWTGGLAGLLLLHRRLGADLPLVAARYSRLAGWAVGLVALTGTVGAAIRLSRAADLATGYGAMVIAEAAGLGVLAICGPLWRRRALRDLADGRSGTFARFAGLELTTLGVLIGLGVALTTGEPPAVARVRSAAESITGYPLPPRLTGARWLTEWQPDLLWLLLATLAAVGYLVAAHRLRARGDHWSVLGTISWLVGLLVLVYVTSGAPAVYGRVLFSLHMLGHMTLSMLVPVFLVLAAPATLALRALQPRRDGTRGPREWLLVVLESRVAQLLSFPPIAAFLFAGSLLFFYYSPLFGVALSTHVGLELMYAHFLFAGYLFAWVLIGIDPGPTRVSQPLRLITLLAAMAFHAFFGVALLSGNTVLAAGYFGPLGRTWGAGLLTDQRLGGGIAWGIGDVPAILMAVILAIQWARDDDREARRLDRAADRDGDAELVAYNAMLERLSESDSPLEHPTGRRD